MRLTFVSLSRGERSLGVSSSRRVGDPLRWQASTLLIVLRNVPHHRGTPTQSVAACETCRELGYALCRLGVILLLRRIRECASPLAIQVHHAHKIRIRLISMA